MGVTVSSSQSRHNPLMLQVGRKGPLRTVAREG